MDVSLLVKEAFEKGGVIFGLLVLAVAGGYVYLLREIARLREKIERDDATARKDQEDRLAEVRMAAERYADLARFSEARLNEVRLARDRAERPPQV